MDGEESGLCLVAHGAYYGELLDAVDRRGSGVRWKTRPWRLIDFRASNLCAACSATETGACEDSPESTPLGHEALATLELEAT